MKIIEYIKELIESVLNNFEAKNYYLGDGNFTQKNISDTLIVNNGNLSFGEENQIIMDGKDVTKEATKNAEQFKSSERRFGDNLSDELKKSIQAMQVEIGRKYAQVAKEDINNTRIVNHENIVFGEENQIIMDGKDVTEEATKSTEQLKSDERKFGDNLSDELKKDIQAKQVEIGEKHTRAEKETNSHNHIINTGNIIQGNGKTIEARDSDDIEL